MEMLEFLLAGQEYCLRPGRPIDDTASACMRPRNHAGPCRFIPGNLFIRASFQPRERFDALLTTAGEVFGVEEEVYA